MRTDGVDHVVLPPRPFRLQQAVQGVGGVLVATLPLAFAYLLVTTPLRDWWTFLPTAVCAVLLVVNLRLLVRRHWTQVELDPRGIRLSGGRWTAAVEHPWADVLKIALDPPGGRRWLRLHLGSGEQVRLPVRDEDRDVVVDHWRARRGGRP